MKKFLIFTLIAASSSAAFFATEAVEQSVKNSSLQPKKSVVEQTPAPVNPQNPAPEGFFASVSDKFSSSTQSVREFISANPEAAVAITAITAAIATTIVIAKSTKVQSFLGFETEEDELIFG